MTTHGPLSGIRILELAGLGPAPFAATMLAELGADVVRVDRPGGAGPKVTPTDSLNRSRQNLVLNMKHETAAETFLALVKTADAVIDPFRPGVADRLGIGPDMCLDTNPRLVYAQMTGWGQTGPLADRAGHDINYLGLTGALHATGSRDKPRQPFNLGADYGGGAMFLISGILAALIARATTGRGQVIDVSMVDGAAALSNLLYGLHAQGAWHDEREANLLDGGAPFYDTYECSDGKFVSVGALEPNFFETVLENLGLAFEQYDRSCWPAMREAFAQAFLTKTRDEWADIFEDQDACVYPVLGLAEAPSHRHMRARKIFEPFQAGFQPRNAPVFSATPLQPIGDESRPGANSTEILERFGLAPHLIEQLVRNGVVEQG